MLTVWEKKFAKNIARMAMDEAESDVRNRFQSPRCQDGMCGGCERCAPELFAPVECVDCGRTYPAYEIGSEDRCLDCWKKLEESEKMEMVK